MLSEDNLYHVCVPEEFRHFPLDFHYSSISQQGYQPSPVSAANIHLVKPARYGVYLILHHMIQAGIAPSFLDVGAYVGDVGLRYGNFFRTIGYNGRVFCFDPSLAGTLIPYNIALNGLEPYVEHRPQAVSDFSGLITFEQKQGHADSACSTSPGAGYPNTIVPCVKLSEFINKQKIQSAFIKLDTENLEIRILADINSFLLETPSVVCFECHGHETALFPVMSKLLETHYLFDVGYLPRPFCFTPVTPDTLQDLQAKIRQYKYGYTDILAISRRMPGVAELVNKLAELKSEPAAYSLIMT
jgi:FkbM family methyltransferase